MMQTLYKVMERIGKQPLDFDRTRPQREREEFKVCYKMRRLYKVMESWQPASRFKPDTNREREREGKVHFYN